jgi:hypothetical protein
MRRVSKTLFLVLIIVPLGSDAILSASAFGTYAAHVPHLEKTNFGALMGFAMLAQLFAWVAWLVLVYKMWSAIQDGNARTTPGRACGFLLIPVFNIYWVFRAVHGFAKDHNQLVDRHSLKVRKLPEGLFLAYALVTILMYIPFLSLLVSTPRFLLALLVIPKICDAVNALPEKLVAVAPKPVIAVPAPTVARTVAATPAIPAMPAREESAKGWYLAVEGQKRGPYNSREVQRLLTEGNIDAARCLAWKEGMAEWLPLTRVRELAALVPPSLPPAVPRPSRVQEGVSQLKAGTGAPMATFVGIGWPNQPADVFLCQGTLLPAKNTMLRKTRRAVPAGGRAAVLRIPVVEGEQPQAAEAQWLIGCLEIPPSRSKKAVPAGSDVEITIHATEAGTVRVKAYLPVLDEEFEGSFSLGRQPLEVAALRLEIEQEQKRLGVVRAQAAGSTSPKVQAAVGQVEQVGLLEAAGTCFAATLPDPPAAEVCRRQLLAFKEALDALEDALLEEKESRDFLDGLGKFYGSQAQS